MKRFVLIVMALTLLISFIGCSNRNLTATCLSAGVKAQAVETKKADGEFIKSQADFAIELFKTSVKQSKGENVLISPLSVQLCLAMTANGAEGKTKTEFEELLGQDIDSLNQYLGSYADSLPSVLKSANSIWFRDDNDALRVEPKFLSDNVSYYNAEIFSAKFDLSTVEDINNWVYDNTDGMIDSVVEDIPANSIMYLINAICFEGKWETPYKSKDTKDGIFTSQEGIRRDIKMMHGEDPRYIVHPGKASGFIKEYKGGKMSFVALLPNEETDIDEYISSLDADSILKAISSPSDIDIKTAIPKFESDYEVSMNDILKDMGLNTAFDALEADFSGTGSSDMGNIYIGNVLHKTYISLDEKGTKAAAVTVVEKRAGAAIDNTKYVILDRPFVYMIIDNSTNLPVFIGTVKDIV